MQEFSQKLVDLVDFLTKSIVDNPDDAHVGLREADEDSIDDDSIVIEIRVNPDDAGKIIGRQGRIIKSIRTVCRAAATGKDCYVDVEVLDD